MTQQTLLYKYPHWPGSFNGREWQTEFAAFEFSLDEVHHLLVEKRDEQEKGLAISGSRRATFAITLKLIGWVEEQIEVGNSEVVWSHPSRQASLEQRQLDNRVWSEAIRKATGKNIQAPLSHPPQFEDSFFGQYLEKLIYAQQFLRCHCPVCATTYAPQLCKIEPWVSEGCGGQRIVCPQGHTLHSRETMEFFP